MNWQEANEYINSHIGDKLERDKSGKGFICPLCGNGSGADGTGLRSKDGGKHWKCFKCGFYGDGIDLLAAMHGLTDDKSKFKAIYEMYGVTVDNTENEHKTQHTDKAIKANKGDVKPIVDYTGYLNECLQNINKTDYLERRGISKETVSGKYAIGYDPNFNGIGGQWQALIIATDKGGFIARNTDPKADKEHRYKNTGSVGIFNKKALCADSKPVFVVEGAIDALSIIEAGGEAIALNSTANANALIRLLEAEPPKAERLFIAMDKDTAGQAAAATLQQGLEGLKIPYITVDITGGYKDANEALQADRELFTSYVKGTAQLPTDREQYLENTGAAHIKDFIDGIKESANTSFISTGFNSLDSHLGGGLTEGLYFIGAISSLGKTTFALQIADNIAQAGQDVLIVSLEMARAELMAKTISRLTFINAKEKSNAKTQLGITSGARYSRYSAEEKELIKQSIRKYAEFAGNIAYIEGVGDITVKEVREMVRKHIFFTGKKPVVVIDYLQILAPCLDRATDKQNIDKAVSELKRISRDYKIPIIGISSFNRDNYNEPVNMGSFKESGAIEYSSDVLIGLQYAGMDYEDKEGADKHAKRTREIYKKALADGREGKARSIELKILKNRKGGAGVSIVYDYFPMFNFFREQDRAVEFEKI